MTSFRDLPLEVVLTAAASSPGAWFCLVRAVKSLDSLARSSPALVASLKRNFSRRVPNELGWHTLLPDGTRHGPFFQEFDFLVTIRGEYQNGLLSGEHRILVGGVVVEVCTYREGMKHGLSLSFGGDGRSMRRVQYFWGVPLTRNR